VFLNVEGVMGLGGRTPRYVTTEDVVHMASLAHIRLTEEEKRLFTEQLNQILEYFRSIDDADTEGVPPSFNILENVVNVFREDEPKPSLTREQAMQSAPEVEKGYFKTGRIV